MTETSPEGRESEPPKQAPVAPLTEPFNVVTFARYGEMLYNPHDIYVGRSFAHYGEYSEGEVELFRHFLQPGMIACDVGANIGAHTVPMAQLVGTGGAVYAFEPQRLAFQALCANVALNSLASVYTFLVALGASEGVATVPLLHPGADQNFGAVSLLGYGGRGEPCATVTLDRAVAKAPHLEFIKIDVEGMEPEVLRGGMETIRKHQPILYVESDRMDRRGELGQVLEDLDYDLWWHTPPLFNPQNFEKNPENIFGDTVSMNLLCYPRSLNLEPPNLPAARFL